MVLLRASHTDRPETESMTCPRCQKPIAAGTVTANTADGTVHVHCATAEERNTPTDFRSARATGYRGPSRPSHKTWKWRGHLSLDC